MCFLKKENHINNLSLKKIAIDPKTKKPKKRNLVLRLS